MRHGQVPQVVPRRFLGQRDVPLDDEGRRQADALGLALAHAPCDAAYCSDLARARETAQRVLACRACGPEPVATPLLREIALGSWEGLTVDEVRERHPGQYERRGADLAGFRPPGGESFADVQARAVLFLDSLEPLAGDVLAVAHGGFNRALLCHVLDLDLAGLFSIRQEYCCVNVLLRSHGRWSVSASGLSLSSPA